MDGNGRWAEMRGKKRTKGHEEGAKAIERVVNASIKHGIRFLTLYCFSTENWKRPQDEVNYLMGLFSKYIVEKIPDFNKMGVRLLFMGNRNGLSKEVLESLDKALEETKSNSVITVQLAINYGGRDEIARSINKALRDGVTEFSPSTLSSYIDNPSVPEPDMICRSAGEKRLSGFMLYQSNYAELGFYDTLWPDWDEKIIEKIIVDYDNRIRKYGGLG